MKEKFIENGTCDFCGKKNVAVNLYYPCSSALSKHGITEEKYLCKKCGGV